MKKLTFLFIAILLIVRPERVFSQCALLTGNTQEVFSPNDNCGIVPLNWEITYQFINPVDPSKVYIVFDWNDPANNQSVNLATPSAGNTEFTATGTFNYNSLLNCSYQPSVSIYWDQAGNGVNPGDICAASTITKTITNWSTDNQFSGNLAISPASQSFC